MIEIKIGEYFIAVPLTAVCRNGMYMRSLNTGEMPYRGSWNLVSMLDGFAVDGEGGGPYLYRELEEARQDGEELEALGEHSTCRGVVTIPGRAKVEEITFDEVVERIGKVLAEMDGQDLADLYNQGFGSGMEYCGDGVFKQTTRLAAEPEAAQPVASEPVEVRNWPADQQRYMQISGPDGKVLSATPISEQFELQDGSYGLYLLCCDEFGHDAGVMISSRIERRLLDKLSQAEASEVSCLGFTARLVTMPEPAFKSLWPADLLEQTGDSDGT